MPLLMQTPAPFVDESPRAYLLRLAEANGYPRFSVIAELLQGSNEYVVTSGWDYARLRSIFGQECLLPEGFGYRRAGKATREGGQLLGHPVHLRHLGLHKSRLCLRCFDELGYVPAKWDMKAYVACPIHGVMMLKNCGMCGRRVRYVRPGLALCACGADLHLTECAPAPPELLAICELLEAKATGAGAVLLHSRLLGMPVESLLAMDLEVLLRVFVMCAMVVRQLGGKSAAPCRQTEIAEALPEVGRAFSCWPLHFSDLCRRWHERYRHGDQLGKGFQACFSWLFVRLHKNLKGKRHQTIFLLEAALRYGYKRWNGKSIRVHEKELQHLALPAKRFLSASEAAQILNVPLYTMFRWLEFGRLPAVSRGSSYKRPCWSLDAEALGSLKFSKFPAIGLREGARYLGVPHAVYSVLIRSGAIPREHFVEFRHCTSREDLDAFRCQIAERAVSIDPALNLVRLRDAFETSFPIAKKVAALRAMADGSIPVYGAKDSAIRDLAVTADHFLDPLRTRAPAGALTIHAARRYDLSFYEARAIFRRLGCKPCGRRGVEAVSVELLQGFLREYVPLRTVALELKVGSTALARALSKLSSGCLLKIPAECGPAKRNNAIVPVFLRREATHLAREAAKDVLRRRR